MSDRSPLSVRALIIGLALVAALAWLTPYVELVQQSSSLTASRLPLGAIAFLFLWLALVNPLLAWLRRRWALRRAEILFIYLMVLVSITLPGNGALLYLFTTLLAPFYYATEENRWADWFQRDLPGWFLPRREETITAFYHGLPPGRPLPWDDWLPSLVMWGAFLLMWLAAYFCLATLLRRRWVEQEKIVFPLAQAPLALLGERDPPDIRNRILRDGLFWIGVAIPALLHSLNALSAHMPAFPHFQMTGWALGKAFTLPPWTGASELTLGIYFAVVGAGYLITADIALSFWFFYLVSVAQRVFFEAYGLSSGGNPAQASATWVLRGEEVGAFLLLALVYLWGARRELKALYSWRGSSRTKLDDANEPLPYRLAGWGLLASLAGLTAWLWLAGATLPMAIAFLLIWHLVALGLARAVAAGGLLYIECSFVTWDPLIYTLGAEALPRRSLTVTAVPLMSLTFDQGPITLPFYTDSMKIVTQERLRPRHFALAVLLATLVALGVGGYAVLKTVYAHGAIALNPAFVADQPQWPFRRLQNWFQMPPEPHLPSTVGMVVGGALAVVVMTLQRHFLWWPFNPIGLLMASTATLRNLWLSIFIAWLAKVTLLRLGGHRVHQRARAFFIGLIVGEFVTGAIWAAIDAWTGVKGYSIVL